MILKDQGGGVPPVLNGKIDPPYRARRGAWQGRWSQDDHFSILATNSGQLQIERIDFLGALITHEQGSIVGS